MNVRTRDVGEAEELPVALVTGGGSGIGREVAHTLASGGYRVVAAGRRRERLGSHGGSHDVVALPCDVGDARQVTELVRSIAERFGRMDVVVNAAGVARPALLEDATLDDIEAQFRTNLLGVVYVSRECIPALRATRGCIINISSTLTARSAAGTAAYTATKGGVEAFSRALALELGPSDIRVNVVSCGAVRTEILVAAGMDVEAYERHLATEASTYPLGRFGEPSDVANVVAFLASPATSWLTGAVIPVDGGHSLGPRPVAGAFGADQQTCRERTDSERSGSATAAGVD